MSCHVCLGEKREIIILTYIRQVCVDEIVTFFCGNYNNINLTAFRHFLSVIELLLLLKSMYPNIYLKF